MRRWRYWLAAGAVALLAVEITVLGLAVWWLGAVWTVVLTFAKWIAGGLLLRRQGIRGWRRFRAAAEAGRPPGREASEAAVGVVAALFVLLGGFVGALLGLVVVVAPVRRRVGRLVARVVQRRLSPVAADGVFGPRRVRVRRGPAGAASPGPVDRGVDTAAAAGGRSADAALPAEPVREVLEGEILPPERR